MPSFSKVSIHIFYLAASLVNIKYPVHNKTLRVVLQQENNQCLYYFPITARPDVFIPLILQHINLFFF